jgi:hypothetical protein
MLEASLARWMKEGVLTFAISAQAESPFRGTELFDLMLRAFGDRVRAVLGVWRRGFEGSPSVNLDKVNERTAAGVSLMDAVQEMWTFRCAARWGFTKVTLINVKERPGSIPRSMCCWRKLRLPNEPIHGRRGAR